MSAFRVAFVQGAPRFGRPDENLDCGLALAGSVSADLVVLPELWSSGYVFSSHAEVARFAEDPSRGLTAKALVAAAKREHRHYVAGFPEAAGGRFYNSAMLVGPAGVKTVYRKLHLFEREREWFSPGNLPLSVHRVGPARVGLMICFDWRFPEVARVLALMGADVLAHPSNLVFPNAQDALRTRALENRVFIVTANRTGVETRPGGRVPFTGQSQIVDPGGEVVLRAGKRDEVALALDLNLALARDKMLTRMTPLFSARRPEFYRPITEVIRSNGTASRKAAEPRPLNSSWRRSTRPATTAPASAPKKPAAAPRRPQ